MHTVRRCNSAATAVRSGGIELTISISAYYDPRHCVAGDSGRQPGRFSEFRKDFF